MKKFSPITLGYWQKYFWRSTINLTESEIKQHRHIMGVTGQGKSRLVAHIASSMLQANIPLAVIDPHSDLVDDILGLLYENKCFERNGYSKLIYVDFSKQDRFLPFNVLKQPYDPYTIARNIVEVCTRAWSSLSDGAAPLFENVMLAAVPLLVTNGLPLTNLDLLLTNKIFREKLLATCADAKIKTFFHDRVDKWKSDQANKLDSVLTRATLLTYGNLHYILGQEQNVLDFRRIMDEGISVLFNLGDLDEATQKILGCLITVGFEQAALSRANIPESQRAPYQLFIDEFPMFSSPSSESLSRMLSLVRKFGLTLTLVNQTWSQTPKQLQGAMGNCLPIYFKLELDDSRWAAPRVGEFDPMQVKEAAASDRGLAVMPSHQEQYELWARKLFKLEPRECYVKGMKIRTVNVSLKPSTRSHVDHLKDYYSHVLLVPKENIVQAPAVASSVRTQRKRKIADAPITQKS